MKRLFSQTLTHPYFSKHPEARKRFIGLVGCGKAKLTTPAPASEFYIGGLTTMSIAWISRNCEQWFILSAKYGLLKPDRVIEPYNTKMDDLSPDEVEAWRQKVAKQFKKLNVDTSRLLACCGSNYVAALPCPVQVDVFGKSRLKMGYRMRWFKQNPVLTDKVIQWTNETPADKQ